MLKRIFAAGLLALAAQSSSAAGIDPTQSTDLHKARTPWTTAPSSGYILANFTRQDLYQRCQATNLRGKLFYSEYSSGRQGWCCTTPDKSQGWCCWQNRSGRYDCAAR